MQKEEPFYKKWEFWTFGIAIILLGIFQGISNNTNSERFTEIFTRLADYEEGHVLFEEIKVEIPSKKEHYDTTKQFNAKVPFSFSGEKSATYFIEWSCLNSEETIDFVAPLDENDDTSISHIKEKDGTKTAMKNYTFLKADIYTITASFYYYVGSDKDLAGNELGIKKQIKDMNSPNSKTRSVSFEVEVKEDG